MLSEKEYNVSSSQWEADLRPWPQSAVKLARTVKNKTEVHQEAASLATHAQTHKWKDILVADSLKNTNVTED
jgi:hypothetical protein